MRLTLIRLLLIVLFVVIFFYAFGLDRPMSVLLAFVFEYIFEPWISEKLR